MTGRQHYMSVTHPESSILQCGQSTDSSRKDNIYLKSGFRIEMEEVRDRDRGRKTRDECGKKNL